MNEAEVLETLESHDAVRGGHFKLSSGEHSDRYVQCALVLQWPGIAERLGHELGDRLAPTRPTVVVGPAMGGLIIAHEVARFLGVRMVFTERVDGAMTLRRGLEVAASDRAAIVEDVVTTGGASREVIGLLHGRNVETVTVGSIVDRSGGRASFGVPFRSLCRVDASTWDAQSCPACAAGDAITSPGSRYVAG